MDNASALQEVMLEFRAGKMYLTGTRVVPDVRKGLVRIGRGEEGLIHFQWLDRTRGVVEDDQIIFPDEALFKKIDQSSDRVFILKFNLDSRRFFFWMQEPESDNDMDLCNSVNNCINQSLALADDDDGEVSIQSQISKISEDTADDENSSRAGSLVNQSISNATSAGPVQLADLQRILGSIKATGTDGEQDGGLGLGDLLKPELVLPLFEKLPINKELVSYLPEGQWTPKDLLDLLQSPPFRQQVETFTHVLRTGQIDLSQFGIDPSKYKFTVLSFLEALEDSVAQTSDALEDSVTKIHEPGETERGKDEKIDTADETEVGKDEMIDTHSRGSRGDAMDES